MKRKMTGMELAFLLTDRIYFFEELIPSGTKEFNGFRHQPFMEKGRNGLRVL